MRGRAMAEEAVDSSKKLSLFSGHPSPTVVARPNDYGIKVVKVKGEFVWHTHERQNTCGLRRRIDVAG